jgi:glutaconate CoA-transferase subunit A
VAKDNQRFQEYLQEWVLGVANHEEYLDKIGMDVLLKIKASPVLGYAPGLDRR